MMSDLDMEHSINISHTPSLVHKQWCVVNITVSETHSLKAEVTRGDFQVLDMEGYPEEYSIPSILFSFDSLRSTRCYDLCEQQLSPFESRMLPTTRQFLAENLVENLMNLVSLCDEDGINLGFVVDARLDVEYFRIADEEDLAPYRLFDEISDIVEDDVGAIATTLFRIVNHGRVPV